jgi:hypothetical protein
MSSGSLKPKHVEALLGQWQREELLVGTIKNRLAAMRWWAQKVDRQNVIACSNAHSDPDPGGLLRLAGAQAR